MNRTGSAALAVSTGNGPLEFAKSVAPSALATVTDAGTALPAIPAATASQLSRLYQKGGLHDQLWASLSRGAAWLSEAPAERREDALRKFLEHATTSWRDYRREAKEIVSLIASEPVRRNFESFHGVKRRQAAALRCQDHAQYAQLSAQARAEFNRLCSAFGDPSLDSVQQLVDDLGTEIQICGLRATGKKSRKDYLDLHLEIAVDLAVSEHNLTLQPELVDRLRRELFETLSEVDQSQDEGRAIEDVDTRDELPQIRLQRYTLLKRLFGDDFENKFPRGFEGLF